MMHKKQILDRRLSRLGKRLKSRGQLIPPCRRHESVRDYDRRTLKRRTKLWIEEETFNVPPLDD